MQYDRNKLTLFELALSLPPESESTVCRSRIFFVINFQTVARVIWFLIGNFRLVTHLLVIMLMRQRRLYCK